MTESGHDAADALSVFGKVTLTRALPGCPRTSGTRARRSCCCLFTQQAPTGHPTPVPGEQGQLIHGPCARGALPRDRESLKRDFVTPFLTSSQAAPPLRAPRAHRAAPKGTCLPLPRPRSASADAGALTPRSATSPVPGRPAERSPCRRTSQTPICRELAVCGHSADTVSCPRGRDPARWTDEDPETQRDQLKC